MKKSFRFLIILSILIVIGIFTSQKALASPPPPIDVTGEPTTESSPYKLGGCITGNVWSFKPGIKLNVALLEGWNAYPTLGLPPMPDYYWTLPGGPADIFSCVVYLRFYDGEKMLKTLPAERGNAEVCVQTAVGKTGSIYFLDEFYNEKPSWQLIGGPFQGGIVACVPAHNSGLYGYYAPDPKGHPEVGKSSGTDRPIIVGSVAAPNSSGTFTNSGNLALDGCVTGNIKDLPADATLDAKVLPSLKGLPDLPKTIEGVCHCLVELKFYNKETFINEIPVEHGNITICFAVPPQSTGSIYFLDKFFKPDAQWEKVGGPFPTGLACGSADHSGYYGLVVKKQ